MPIVRVHNFSISLDGFGTGEGQSLESPFGHAGRRLMEWAFQTKTFRDMGLPGEGEVSTGLDDEFARRWKTNIGVEIMGRNKFGPQRGEWKDHEWIGWWGEHPPFDTPVLVLTHHPRPTLHLQGGNVFHFVDANPVEALNLAKELAPDSDIRIGGGVHTIRQFLFADLIDYMHIVVVPVILGRGENLWTALEGLEERFNLKSTVSPQGVIHIEFTRKSLADDLDFKPVAD